MIAEKDIELLLAHADMATRDGIRRACKDALSGSWGTMPSPVNELAGAMLRVA